MIRLQALILSLTCFVFLLSPIFGYGQERCGIVEYERLRHSKISGLETQDQFEQWMQKRIGDNKLRTHQIGRVEANTYTIPVVVHVIHNGEAIGAGTNIPDDQIISQIQVINDDYKRLNADKTNTPAEFQPVAGSIDLQFVLAKQDPEGLATNGITRTLGTKPSWTINDNTEFKALSYWPAENYLNIWVINLSGSIIGYAQLPVSTQLPGLEDSSNDRLTDGVIVDYQTFGSTAGGNFNLETAFNKGRTATHEIGHFLGLRHIWGDGSSCNTDYVDDTPPQSASTSSSVICPSNPQTSCSGHKMFQNYMDYTADACMNIFTQGQIGRMVVVLQSSPRRTSLLTSPGASDPVVVSIDLGIRQIITPQSSLCSSPVTPQIEVKNYGSTSVTSTQIQLLVNGNIVETKTFSSLTLANLQSTTLAFSPLNFTSSSTQQVSFQIILTNGTTDGKSSNNSASVQVTVPSKIPLPVIEAFSTVPSGWQILNPDGDITWANVLSPDNSTSMYMNFNNYQNEGTLDWLITPSFSLSIPFNSQLKFDVAYAQFPGESGDVLQVYALPGCNTDLSQGILLYEKSGAALATTTSTSSNFKPTSDAQWRRSEVVSLGGLSASSNWQLAFVAKNGYGNNLYIDNAIISDGVTNDIALSSIVSPGLVHCQSNPVIQFNVKNFSTAPITGFQVQRTLNSGTVVTQSFSGISLAVGEEKTFSLNAVALNKGVNQITLNIINPNGFTDSSPSNNTITFNSYVDLSVDRTPLRMTFDNAVEIPWILATPFNAQAWISTNTNKNQSVSYKAFTNTVVGEESWLVSPILDLSRYDNQSLLFDVSYAQKVPADDRLKILASSDCGLTYPTVLMDRAGSEFSVTNSSSSWTPTSNNDWKREYADLLGIAGKTNVRLAFVVTNQHGNNIYLDNIEIFAGQDAQPPVTTLPYQFYYSSRNSSSDLAVTFNLPQRTDVRLQIFSIMGQIVADNLLTETLNQTYYFDLSGQSAGLYIFRVQINDQISSTKVYIGH